MPHPSDLKPLLTQAKQKLAQKYPIQQLGLFGSYRRGDQHPNSDIDILISFDPNFRFGLLTFCQIENELSDLLGQKVDLVLKDSLKPHIGQHILREVLYIE